jgi:hypothetical protein
VSDKVLGRHRACDRQDSHRDIRRRQGSGKGGIQPGRSGGEPGGRGQACRRRDRDVVSALPDQGGTVLGGLPACGGAPCRTGQTVRGRDGASRGAAPLAAGRRGIHGDEERHDRGARHGRARFLGACGPIRSTADRGSGGTAAACHGGGRVSCRNRPRRTSSVRWSGCTTPTIDRVGKQCWAWSMSSSMDYAGDPIRETIDRPVTLFHERSPDIAVRQGVPSKR